MCSDNLDAVLIAGPTASGKSALALEIAELIEAEIVNADSMQVYDGLSVLSARPSTAETARIRHHLYGFVDAGRSYSVGDFLRDVAPVLADLKARKKRAVVVGGTGLYFRALTEGLVETPTVPAELRARLEAEAASGADLHGRLAARDPAGAARLNPADTVRILRALEIVEATGQSLAEWQRAGQGAPLIAPGRWKGLFLNPDRAELFARIDGRFIAMIEQGALDEVRALMALGLPPNRGIMKAHGVPHLMAHLRGELSLADAIKLGQQDTRRYAKRQLTWARKFMAGWEWRSSAADALRR